MKAKVTEDGVVIPKQWLAGVAEVDIQRQANMIVVVPVGEPDPILELGKDPIADRETDASDNHDRYLYSP